MLGGGGDGGRGYGCFAEHRACDLTRLTWPGKKWIILYWEIIILFVLGDYNKIYYDFQKENVIRYTVSEISIDPVHKSVLFCITV